MTWMMTKHKNKIFLFILASILHSLTMLCVCDALIPYIALRVCL